MHEHNMKLRTQFLHFDSIHAQYVTDFSNNTDVPNAYNCIFKTHTTFENVERVSLTCLELPVGFVNVRKGSTDSITFLVNGNIYNVVLQEKNYSTIFNLISDLNLACVGIVPDLTITFSQSPSVPRLLVTLSGSLAVTSFSIKDTNLSMYLLGFRQSQDKLVAGVYAASFSNYNLNADNYIHLYFKNIPGINAAMGGGARSSFKIPFNSVSNNVFFIAEQNNFVQFIDCRNSNFNLSSINAVILDRYGLPINPRGFDYSFTLSIQYRG